MDIPKVARGQYEAWAKDLYNLKLPDPTQEDLENATRISLVEVQSTHEGCMIRFAAMSGGGIDLYLNAAQAVHLFRYLAFAGQVGGWMDKNGQPVTDPPVQQEFQRLPPLDQI